MHKVCVLCIPEGPTGLGWGQSERWRQQRRRECINSVCFFSLSDGIKCSARKWLVSDPESQVWQACGICVLPNTSQQCMPMEQNYMQQRHCHSNKCKNLSPGDREASTPFKLGFKYEWFGQVQYLTNLCKPPC